MSVGTAWETEQYNSVLEITVSFLGIHMGTRHSYWILRPFICSVKTHELLLRYGNGNLVIYSSLWPVQVIKMLLKERHKLVCVGH
jgi:hypothetical protein